MKHFTKLFVGILFLILGGTQSGMAQTIDDLLLEKAADPKDVAGMMEDDGKTPVYVYLYNVTKKKFVHGGGEYGAQAVLSDRGIRFKVTNITDGVYSLESAIYNSSHDGGCLGVDVYKKDNSGYKIYIDKGANEPVNDNNFRVGNISSITFESTGSGKNRYYLTTTISRNDGIFIPDWNDYKLYYSYVDNNNGEKYIHASTTGRDEWCLIKRDDYNIILGDVAQQGRYNITGLVGNSRFLRNVSDENNLFRSTTGLKKATSDDPGSDYCTTIHPMIGAVSGDTNNDNYARDYGAFGCLEIGAVTASEESPVEFYQEIKGLTPGLYMVEAQAFFDQDDESRYDNGYQTENHTTASNAYLFANGAETLIPMLDERDYDLFNGDVTTLYNALSGTNRQYFRRNVAAAYFLAQENEYEPDESFHRVRVYVNVKADEGETTGTLKLGVNKKGMGGRVYVDNFGLYYVGDNEIGLDAYQRDVNKVDQNTYLQQYPFHLSRKFVLSEKDPINPENDKWNWNAITLPMDVYASQITETFGEDAKLCKLEGVNTKNKDQILFKPVDLSDNSKPAIERGGCYLICVTKGPEFPAGEAYTFLVKKENAPEQTSQNMEFPYGNIYTINGVSCPEGMRTPDDNNNTVSTKDGKLSYTYFYHRPGEKQGDTPVPAGSYVMSGGKMYHLPQAWDGLLGTCWYITDLTTSSNSKVMAIEGEGGTTDINGIVTEVPGDKVMEGVYNINGQKVADGTSLEGLPKGIYIVNGKKHVVK